MVYYCIISQHTDEHTSRWQPGGEDETHASPRWDPPLRKHYRLSMANLDPLTSLNRDTQSQGAAESSAGQQSSAASIGAPAEVGTRSDLQNTSPNRSRPKESPSSTGSVSADSRTGRSDLGPGETRDSRGALSPSKGEQTSSPKGQNASLQSKVQDLMSQYANGAISQGELVRQLKMVNNVLAHNMVKEAKQALGGSTALATSPEHQSQLPQSRSLLEDNATNVKAAGVEETGPPPPEKAESAYGAMGQDGALSTDHEKQQEEQRQHKQEADQQMLEGIIADRETNEQAQIQRTNQIVEQNARAAQDKQRQMQEQQKQQEAQTQEIAGQRGQIGEFLRTSSKASAQKQKYLQRTKSRTSVGVIPRLDKELSLGPHQQQSVAHGSRDSKKRSGEHEEEEFLEMVGDGIAFEDSPEGARDSSSSIDPGEDPQREESQENTNPGTDPTPAGSGRSKPSLEPQPLPDWFKPLGDTKW